MQVQKETEEFKLAIKKYQLLPKIKDCFHRYTLVSDL